ncbi:Alpha-L-fucosidase [Handroanthus impetiginosus]|uniref:Alpha-L-fucosidase n=1 Tax=Handroanthus impetiginosus TaxID=429701 RepID=A0A2G9HKZ2_9LAMI|nr:Alpha-L-fucosidase [Handroanthus impetiginosus]
MGPLGCLPRIIAIFGKNTSKLDELQCVGSHNHAAKLFNLQLHALSADFQTEFPEAKVTYVDIYGIKANLIANYSRYGFKQALAACCGYGGLPLNFDTRIACGETKVLNGTMVTAGACSNTTEYVNWDGNHYAEAANQPVSSQILSGKYLDSPPDVDLHFS